MNMKFHLLAMIGVAAMALAPATAEAQRRMVNPNPGSGKFLGVNTRLVQLGNHGGGGSGPVRMVVPNPGGGGGSGSWGAKITRVHMNTPAKRAGLECDDIIVQADNTFIQNENSLRNAIQNSGRYMDLQVINKRNGQIVPVQVDFGYGHGGGGGGGGGIGGGGGGTPVYQTDVQFGIRKMTWSGIHDVDGSNEFQIELVGQGLEQR